MQDKHRYNDLCHTERYGGFPRNILTISTQNLSGLINMYMSKKQPVKADPKCRNCQNSMERYLPQSVKDRKKGPQK